MTSGRGALTNDETCTRASAQVPPRVRRGQCYLLTIGFLAVIACVAPFQAASEIRQGQTPQALDLVMRAPSVANLRSYEKSLESESVAAGAVRPAMQYLRYLVFGDAGEKAVVGRRGWWFYRPDVRYLVEPFREDSVSRTGRQTAVRAIVSFRDQLSRRGIRLLVIPVPGKPSVYPDMLTRRAAACDPRVREHTRSLIADLAAAGVETVDLFQAFARARAASGGRDGDKWYLARDTHWTNKGARLAAQTVARHVLDLGWAETGTVRYDLQPTIVNRPGDVLRMLRCPPIEAIFEPEAVECDRVVRADDGQSYRDDPSADILVLGDSFLRIYERDEPGSAGFIAHLARELGRPLASIVNDGGASTLVRQELARNPELLSGKKLVIWEFVERDARFGMEGWQNVPLPETASRESGPASE